MVETVLSGIAAASAAAEVLSGIVRSTKGAQRGLLLELKGNILLLRNYCRHNLPEEKVIEELSTRQLQTVLESNFDFKKLNRKPLSSDTAGSGFGKRYIGWATEKLFENMYLKIESLKRLARIGFRNTGIRASVRLSNLLKLMVLTVMHLELK